MFRMNERLGFSTAYICVVGLLCSWVLASRASAVSVTQSYLFSTFSTTPGPSGTPTGVNPPFSFTALDGVQLGLNSSGVATSSSDVGTTGPFNINSALTYQTHSLTVDSGESLIGGSFSTHVNSEVGRLDDVGIVNEGPTDALLNIDFNNDAAVTFAIPTGGYTHLLIAEDAGLDPFKLSLCSDAGCSAPQTLFNGLSFSVRTTLIGRTDFGGSDYGAEIDQIYLFLFDQPATGFFRISETTNYLTSSSTLEIDFAGGSTPQAPVPEPGTLLLLGSGFAGMGYFFRKRLLD